MIHEKSQREQDTEDDLFRREEQRVRREEENKRHNQFMEMMMMDILKKNGKELCLPPFLYCGRLINPLASRVR